MELRQDSASGIGFQLPSLVSLALGHVGLSRPIVWDLRWQSAGTQPDEFPESDLLGSGHCTLTFYLGKRSKRPPPTSA